MNTASFGSLVRVVTGHLVSSSSMVSRAYLTDTWRAVIVSVGSGGPWLAATSDALAPDTDGLIGRGREAGGPPPEHARATLAKISISWGNVVGLGIREGEAHVVNPRVVEHPGGASVAVVSLARVRGLDSVGTDAAFPGSWVLEVDDMDHADRDSDDEFGVLTLFPSDDGSYWPIVRRARRVSDPNTDFLGESGAVAVEFRLGQDDTGSPVTVGRGSDVTFRGLVRPVSSEIAMLLPRRLIVETIIHAESEG